MKSVLLATISGKAEEAFLSLLKGAGYSQVMAVSSAAEARRCLARLEVELLVIDTPLKDESGQELALFAASGSTAGIVLLLKSGTPQELAIQAEEAGVFPLYKPMARPQLLQTLRMAAAIHRRMSGLGNENRSLRKKMEELRLIDRAKCILIQQLGLSEPQAHRYIEKQAMDCRLTRVEIAQNLLLTYE